MGLYEGIKDVARVVQKADNIELYKQLVELSAQALDLQNQVSELITENKKLKEQKDISNRIERHKEAYITLKDDDEHILYCSHCWDSKRILVQCDCNNRIGQMFCPECKEHFVYDYPKFYNKNTGIISSKVYGL